MPQPPTLYDRVSRRSVLKTSGLIAAGALVANPASAQEEGLQMDVRRGAIDLDRDEVLAVEVAFPQDIFFPHDTFLGVREAFYVIEGEDGGTVGFNDEYVIDDLVATPIDVREVSDTRAVLYFSTEDIFFPQDIFEGDEVTLGLGVFPEGPRHEIPGTNWDTDTVTLAPTRERVEELQLDIRRGAIHPERDEVLAVEVAFPQETFFPQETYLGVRQAFEVEATEEGLLVSVGSLGQVTSPVRIRETSGDRWIMHFNPTDVYFPHDTFEEGEVTLGLGVFPEGAEEAIPGTDWDTDSVRIVNGIA